MRFRPLASRRRALSINQRELMAVQLGVAHFVDRLRGHSVVVFIDNVTAALSVTPGEDCLLGPQQRGPRDPQLGGGPGNLLYPISSWVAGMYWQIPCQEGTRACILKTICGTLTLTGPRNLMGSSKSAYSKQQKLQEPAKLPVN